MAPDLATGPSDPRALRAGGRAAAQIDSDHVVEVVTAGVDEETGAPYLVMELLRGEELHDAAERLGPLPVGDVRGGALRRWGTRWSAPTPRASSTAISSRRTCSSRCRVGSDAPFTAKILDFGIAKLVADSCRRRARSRSAAPLFMSARADRSQRAHLPGDRRVGAGPDRVQAPHRADFWKRDRRLAPDAAARDLRRADPVRDGARGTSSAPTRLPVGFDAWFARCVNRDIDKRVRRRR
jgi:hypothetical protein